MNNTFTNSHYTVFVNSCDSFEDCWNPFFTLFAAHWNSPVSNLVLNTEQKTYKFPGLNIHCSKVGTGPDGKRLSWSECLISALNDIETPLVLYLQEDYFIEHNVNTRLVDEMAEMMGKDDEIKYIGLTNIGNYPPFLIYEKDPRLVIVSRKSRYRISLQAGLWRKEILLSYLRSDENAWMFEIFGTIRSRNRNELFLTLNRNINDIKKMPVIVYKHTGIIKGKWHPEMPLLFESHGINIDFSLRGIYREKYLILRKIETVATLIKNPLKFVNGLLGR